ncbi:thymidylate kinase-domain-containing protein [Xylaria bambusicola]|uniref:thymidylate kinase-domain-containing protein n=1 Tax=Xylaria bambusicola TaxID=326684 RepID=UPI002008040B|nr:thymidylate kinase-domain-containing protein [Xylaria bambusicola]KAI0525391.1 thymidylate kinase-domain-containing protein [Xylaria bambusicola]
MASINDLATAATIASSAVALQSSPKEQTERPDSPSSPPPPEDPLSPPSPSPSAQLQAQAQEAHAQRIVSAGNRSPAPEVAEPNEVPSTPGAATAASSAPNSNSIVANVGAVTPHTPTLTPTQGPVLAAPLISQNPAQATIPPQASPETAPENDEGSPEKEDSMDGIEYESEQKKPPVRGAFIVFEGMDRAGKTTQAKLLQLRCIESGREVKFMRFPDRTTPIGQMIDSYLKGEAEIEDHVIHLLFSANRWEAAQKIRTELEAGHTIICDRFYHSGIVYSAAKQLPSLSLSWAKAPELGLPRPDMVLFLDLEESVARSRGGWGGEVYEKGEMQRRVRELFWGLSMGDLGPAVSGSKGAANNGKGPSRNERVPFGNGMNSSTARDREGGDAEAEGEFRQEEEDIQIVDADVGVEELAEKVWEIVRGRIEAVERGEEGRSVRTVK